MVLIRLHHLKVHFSKNLLHHQYIPIFHVEQKVLLSQEGDVKPGESLKAEPQINIKTTKKSSSDDFRRATFIVKKEHFEKLKDLAYWDRTSIKKLLHEALENYFQNKQLPKHVRKTRTERECVG